jgi:hypothetical protein
MEIDLSHEWQTVTSTIFILKYFQHVCALAKWLFYDLKKSSEILKSPPLSQKSCTKLFKYLMEIDLSHEWQTVTSTIFILKYFQHVCKLWQNGYFYDLKVFRDSKSPPLSQKS